jgi:hypothetical protein
LFKLCGIVQGFAGVFKEVASDLPFEVGEAAEGTEEVVSKAVFGVVKLGFSAGTSSPNGAKYVHRPHRAAGSFPEAMPAIRGSRSFYTSGWPGQRPDSSAPAHTRKQKVKDLTTVKREEAVKPKAGAGSGAQPLTGKSFYGARGLK